MSSVAEQLPEPDVWENDPHVWQWVKRISFAGVAVLVLILVAGLLVFYTRSVPLGLATWPMYLLGLLPVFLVTAVSIGFFAKKREALLSEDVWVDQLVPEIKRRLKGERLSSWIVSQVRSASWEFARSMVRPRLPAIALGVLAFLTATLLFYLAGKPGDSGVSGRYLTLWQLQAGLTSIALPLLIFIIQFGGEELKVRQQKTRALIHLTWVLPILLVLAGFLMAFGVGTVWPEGNSYWIGMSLFSLGVILTMMAFVRLLMAISHPKQIDEASIRLLERLFDEQMESALDERIGSNVVRNVLNANGAKYNPYWSERPEYVVVSAFRTGIIRSIHLGRLSAFLRSLPRRGAGVADASADDPSRPANEDQEGLGGDGPPDVIWRYGYGDRIVKDREGVVLLREGAFEDLNKTELEVEVANLMKIEEAT